MFTETRYALNGDLRVAYRASREGPRDIVFVSNWFTNCEVFPELPSLRGWVEAVRLPTAAPAAWYVPNQTTSRSRAAAPLMDAPSSRAQRSRFRTTVG